MRKETLSRIESAIADLNYRPNRVAQQLKTGQTPMLGLLVPSIVNPSFAALTRAVDIAAQEKLGYHVLLGNTYRNQEKEASFLDDLLSYGIKGVIVVSTQVNQPHFKAAVDKGLIMVNYDGRIHASDLAENTQIDNVSMNNFLAGKIACQHLLDHGCQRVIFATESGKIISRQEKIEGFMSVAPASASIIEGKAEIAYGDAEMAELGKSLAAKIVRMTPRPDGIVAVNDMLAIGLIAGLRNLNIRIPEDISIVGIDNISLASLVNPALTTIAPPITAMADIMVDRLIKRLADPTVSAEEYLFTPTLVCRDSVQSL
jgi:DNA-binding LacI/PurR family transcriptional regulator